LELRFATTTQINQPKFNPVNTSSLQTKLFTEGKIKNLCVIDQIVGLKKAFVGDIPTLCGLWKTDYLGKFH
jgi:hypothetical protein